MSADAYINPNKKLKLMIFCYICNSPIILDNPGKGHEECLRKQADGSFKIPISVDYWQDNEHIG